MNINCELSNPVKADGVPPNLNSQIWNFKTINCVATSTPNDPELPEYITKITSTSTPERSFYISNTIDVGQILCIGIFVLTLAFWLIVLTKNLIIKR